MGKIKLSALTKKELAQVEIRPVNVEDYTEETINECFPEIELLGQFKRSQGSLIRQTDEVMFRMCCRDEESHNVADKRWVEVDGDFYDVEELTRKFEDADLEVENDL